MVPAKNDALTETNWRSAVLVAVGQANAALDLWGERHVRVGDRKASVIVRWGDEAHVTVRYVSHFSSGHLDDDELAAAMPAPPGPAVAVETCDWVQGAVFPQATVATLVDLVLRALKDEGVPGNRS